jgi:uncharacterized protein with HEPN domain
MKDRKVESLERLSHIREAIHQIEVFVKDTDKQAFLNHQLVASAVLFQFSVIGEAIVHVNLDILEKYEYPWYKVRAFRNLISHMYFQIKLVAVWDIIVNDLPDLKQVIESILKEQF